MYALFPKILKNLVDNLSVPQRRSGQQQRVDAVQHAAMTGQQRSGILDANRPFQRGFSQVAQLRGHVYHCGQQQPVPGSSG